MDDCPETTEGPGSGANAANICLVSVIHQGSAVFSSVPFVFWVLILCSVTLCPQGSLVPPMPSCFVCCSLIVFTLLCSEGTTKASSYVPCSLWLENILEKGVLLYEARGQLMSQEELYVPVHLLQPISVGTAHPFQDSRLPSESESHTAFDLQRSQWHWEKLHQWLIKEGKIHIHHNGCLSAEIKVLFPIFPVWIIFSHYTRNLLKQCSKRLLM